MKFILIVLVFMFAGQLAAQDTTWSAEDGSQVVKERATQFTICEKNKTGTFTCTTRSKNNNTIRGRGDYADTSGTGKPIGWQVIYRANGRLQDSVYFNDASERLEIFRFHPNKQLAAHYTAEHDGKKETFEGYDVTGEKIKNYIFGRQAYFKGGDEAWVKYLKKAISKELVSKTNAEETVTVRVQFAIDIDGSTTQPKIMKSSGNPEVDRDALRIITDSPKWVNAIQYNEPLKVYRLQPITYVLYPAKKTKS